MGGCLDSFLSEEQPGGPPRDPRLYIRGSDVQQRSNTDATKPKSWSREENMRRTASLRDYSLILRRGDRFIRSV